MNKIEKVQTMTYRGYSGTIDASGDLLCGVVININGDEVDYEAYNVIELRVEFEKAVDEYIEVRKERLK